LAAPWLLVAMLTMSAVLTGAAYRAALIAQVVGYGIALAGMNPYVAARSRVASAAASFVVLNAAAGLAFWVWATGGAEASWKKAIYRPADAPSDPKQSMPSLDPPSDLALAVPTNSITPL
jgi:hypothetical protein